MAKKAAIKQFWNVLPNVTKEMTYLNLITVTTEQITSNDCLFEFITSQSNGGVIYSKSIKTLFVTKSRFIHCRTYSDGGSIYVSRDNFNSNINYSCFDMCSSDGENA